MPGREQPPYRCLLGLKSTMSPVPGTFPPAQDLPRAPTHFLLAVSTTNGQKEEIRTGSHCPFSRDPPHFPVCLPLLPGSSLPAPSPPRHVPIASAPRLRRECPAPHPWNFWLSSQTMAPRQRWTPASLLNTGPARTRPSAKVFQWKH